MQFSGLPAAPVLGSSGWSAEGEIGQPVQSVSVSQIYDGKTEFRGGLSTVMLGYKTLLGAPASLRPLPAWASPGCDSVVLPVPGAAPNAGNTHGIARALAPHGAGMAQGRLKIQNILQCGIALNFSRMKSVLFPKFSGILVFLSEKSGRTNFRSKLFWIFQISNRKKYGRKNFESKIFSVFQISRPEKVRVFRSRCRVRISGFTPRE